MTLAELKIHEFTITQALRVAAEAYQRDATEPAYLSQPRISEQFERQAQVARELAERIEEEGFEEESPMSTDERRSDAGITGPRHAFEDEPQPQEPEYEGEGEKDDGELPGDYDDSIGPFPQEPAPGSPEAVKAAAEALQRWWVSDEIAALKEELERQSTAAGTLSDLIEKRTEERDALGDALKDLYLSCRKWAPTIDRSRAEAILRKIGRLA